MAAPRNQAGLDLERTMAGVLALLAADREDKLSDEGSAARKTEVVLAAAGLNAPEIAKLLGKNDEAVRKTLQREKVARGANEHSSVA